MPTAVIEARVTGSLDQADKRAMLFIIAQENARRAALDPPGEPLLTTDNPTIRGSYAVVQSAILNSAHLSYVDQSDIASLADIRAAWEAATDNQRNACLAALTS